jgi:hypothetical protein
MKAKRYTLISDGPSDANLIPIINWVLKEVANVDLSQGSLAELWRLPPPFPVSFAERIAKAATHYPCDFLFIHRDAERQPAADRHKEIRTAFSDASNYKVNLPSVAVVPVRMSEAWLIFDESAIRNAAGNPNGILPLNLPALNRLETRPDPKKELGEALLQASELTGRRRNKFNKTQAFWRIVDDIEDYAPLRQLSAFQTFEKSVKKMAQNNFAPGFYGAGE